MLPLVFVLLVLCVCSSYRAVFVQSLSTGAKLLRCTSPVSRIGSISRGIALSSSTSADKSPAGSGRDRGGSLLALIRFPIENFTKSKFWGTYNRAINDPGIKSIRTKSVSSAIGFSVGDILAQMFFTPNNIPFSFARLFRMASLGGVIHGPASHFFYRQLEEYFPGNASMTITSKVVIDQIFWTPVFAALVFLYTGVVARVPGVLILASLVKAVRRYTMMSWAIWPAAHYVNFKFIPAKNRLLYINVVQTIFNTMISVITNSFLLGNLLSR
jgi:hypothetical protein